VRQLLLDLTQPPAPTLENFAPGRNGELLALLVRWLKGATQERCVYLWGVPGSGKSHLLRGVAAAVAAQGGAVSYGATGSAVVQWLPAPVPWLVVDDVERLGSEGEAALFTLLNLAAQRELRLLMAGPIAPAGLRVRADVRTRIGAGLVFQVQPLSDEEKVEALCGHAMARGFSLTRDVAEYLLRHGRRDLPSLLTVLDALDRYSLQVKRPITVPLVREVLQSGPEGVA
jgi:DnaA family protein